VRGEGREGKKERKRENEKCGKCERGKKERGIENNKWTDNPFLVQEGVSEKGERRGKNHHLGVWANCPTLLLCEQ
jgi:hypothetical protein